MSDSLPPYASLDDFVETRRKAVHHGLESKELAALMVEKFAEGIASCGQDVIRQADLFCISIDPAYRENRRLRYQRIAKLDLATPRPVDPD